MNKISENGVSFSEYTLPKNITQLFKTTAVQNVNEAVTVIFHAYLLESGFLPKDVPDEDKYHYMPKDWNANGVFKINYVHKCCTAFACSVSFVFLYNNVSVHGIVCETTCLDSVHMKMNFKKYIKQKTDFSSVNEVFCNLEELCILFKDNFSLPFLNLLHETIGERPLSGMPGLYDELKLYILQLLSVEHVLKMSAVNKNFNYLANSSSLWKHLCQRDFSKAGVPDIDSPSSSSSSTESNWKEVYKKEFINKRKKESFLRLPRYPIPQFFDISPDIYTDIGINFDPPFPIFDPPFLQPKMPPFFRRLL